MSSLPIACTLNATELAAVRDGYLMAARYYRATARIGNDRADVTLTGDKTTLRPFLKDMVERESGCCSFLTFEVVETTEGFDICIRTDAADQLGHGILRESVATFFPAATTTQ
jgi:hypothetical protein